MGYEKNKEQTNHSRFLRWLSERWIQHHGFDRRRKTTKVFEFLYFRFLSDIMACFIAVMIVVVRVGLIFEIEGIPYSGTMEMTNETIIIILLSLWIVVGRVEAIREFYRYVITQIPAIKQQLNG